LDGYGKISTRFRLYANNSAASSQKSTNVAQLRNPNIYSYSGTLRDHEGAGQKNATEADILRLGSDFLVGQFD
jgi:hypothetical protein